MKSVRSESPVPPFEPDCAAFFAVSLDLMVIRDAEFRFLKVNKAWETVLGHAARAAPDGTRKLCCSPTP